MYLTRYVAVISFSAGALLLACTAQAQNPCIAYQQCYSKQCSAFEASPTARKCTYVKNAVPPRVVCTQQSCPGTFPACGVPPPCAVSGHIFPQYMVVNVVYAPPGMSAKTGASSSVDYGSSTSAGTSVTTESNFTNGASVTAGAGVDAGVAFKASVSGTFSTSASQTQKSEIDMTTAAGLDLSLAGPQTDGIDHNGDLIYLLLGPTVDVVFSFPGPAPTPNTTYWGLDSSVQAAPVVPVYVFELHNPASMDPTKAALLAKFGVTPAIFPAILARDPFADNSHNSMDPSNPTMDPNRFAWTGNSFPYSPSPNPNYAVPVSSFTLSNDLTNKTSVTTEDKYTVAVKTDMSGSYEFFSANLSTANTWDWSDTSTQGQTNESKQSATAKVGGPAYGYPGCIIVDAYYDRVYGTFVFAFDSVSCPAPAAPAAVQLVKPIAPITSVVTRGIGPGLSVTGVVKNKAGQLVTGAPVVLIPPTGARQRTYTNPAGGFVFNHVQAAGGQLSVGAVTVPVQNGANQIVLP